jgi:hypothetical protein
MVNGRNETPSERCDRNMIELLQEVRVAQTAVQVLLGFLIAVAFTPRFRTLSTFQRTDYFVSLLAGGVAAIFLIAPASYHRLLFRLGDKEHIVAAANRLVIVGLAALAAAIVSVTVLLTDLLFVPALTIAMGAATIGACAVTWYILPLARRRSIRSSTNGKAETAGSTPPSGSTPPIGGLPHGSGPGRVRARSQGTIAQLTSRVG